MKFSFAPEIYTAKFEQSLEFYQHCLGFMPRRDMSGFQEMEGFAILRRKENPTYALYICKANSPGVNKLFWPSFHSKGLIFQIEVDHIDSIHQTM